MTARINGRGRRRISRTISLYIAWEIAKLTLLVFLILVSIHGTVFTIHAIREFGFDLFLLFPVFWRTFAYALFHSIPLSVLLATGLVFGRLVADREIAALRSAGISDLEMLVAPAALGLLLCTSGYFINGYLVPEMHFAKRNLAQLLLDQLQYLGDGYDRSVPLDHRGQNVLFIKEYRRGKLLDIFLFAQDPGNVFGGAPGEKEVAPGASEAPGILAMYRGDRKIESRSFPLVLHAEEGSVRTEVPDGRKRVLFELRGVHIFYDNDMWHRQTKSDFVQVARISRLSIPFDIDEKERGIKDMPMPMLDLFIRDRAEQLRRLRGSREPEDDPARLRVRTELAKARTVYHNRLTLSAVCFVFPVSIAILALFLNSRNSLLPFFIGVTVNCSVFFALESFGDKLSVAWNFPWLEHLGNVALLAMAILIWLRLERLPRRLGKRWFTHRTAGDEEGP